MEQKLFLEVRLAKRCARSWSGSPISWHFRMEHKLFSFLHNSTAAPLLLVNSWTIL